MGQASDASEGHGWQDTSHGNPKSKQDVKMEIVQARRMTPANYIMPNTGNGSWCREHKSENITYSLMRL